MKTDKNYFNMNSKDLMKELDRLTDDLEDLEQEREYLLRRTGAHVSESAVKGTETAISSLQEAIQKIRGILQERGFGARMLTLEAKKKP